MCSCFQAACLSENWLDFCDKNVWAHIKLAQLLIKKSLIITLSNWCEIAFHGFDPLEGDKFIMQINLSVQTEEQQQDEF